MKELIEIVKRHQTGHPIKHGRVEGMGVLDLLEDYEKGSKNGIKRSELNEVLREIPLKRNYLTNIYNNKVIFIDLNNEEIINKLNKDQQLFSTLDRLVQYMLLNNKDGLYFKRDVYSRDKNTSKVERDTNLSKYNSEGVYYSIIKDACEVGNDQLRTSKLEGSYEHIVLTQGVEVKIMTWEDYYSRELIMQILPPTKGLPEAPRQMLTSGEGFIMLNRDLIRGLHEVLNDGTYKRIAYRDLGTFVDDASSLVSNFSGDTSIEDLRNRDYDVYVINLEKIEQIKELMYLPTNKLCVLTLPTNSIQKALAHISLFKGDSISMSHLVDNMLGIIISEDEYLVLDDWSRELIKNETDTYTMIEKLQTSFIIRDNIDLAKEINIKNEIKLLLEKAERIGATNIDICPGSPIRLYKSKKRYEFYSSIKMTPILVEILAMNLVSGKEFEKLIETGDVDTSYSMPQVGRYRVGFVKQRSSLAISIRSIPRRAPKAEDLNLPEGFVDEVLSYQKGMTLIVGETNSGKSTTLHCLISEANERMGGIIFLMGTPIEYLHNHRNAMVIQAEVGKDIQTYAQGMVKSLRMNTSLIGFEELRTKEEIASLGVLMNTPNAMLTTSHTSSVRKAIENQVERLSETGISMSKAQEDVANNLNCVIYQQLIDYNNKRVLIYEKLRVTPTIRNIIRKGNYNQLDHAILTEPGCISLDRVIMDRLREGMLDFESVKPYIKDKSFFVMNGYKFD